MVRTGGQGEQIRRVGPPVNGTAANEAGCVQNVAVPDDSPAMLFRFWYMAWCGELGALAEPLDFCGSWLAVVLMNSMADWRTRNCNATAISWSEKRQFVIKVHLVGFFPHFQNC